MPPGDGLQPASKVGSRSLAKGGGGDEAIQSYEILLQTLLSELSTKLATEHRRCVTLVRAGSAGTSDTRTSSAADGTSPRFFGPLTAPFGASPSSSPSSSVSASAACSPRQGAIAPAPAAGSEEQDKTLSSSTLPLSSSSLSSSSTALPQTSSWLPAPPPTQPISAPDPPSSPTTELLTVNSPVSPNRAQYSAKVSATILARKRSVERAMAASTPSSTPTGPTAASSTLVKLRSLEDQLLQDGHGTSDAIIEGLARSHSGLSGSNESVPEAALQADRAGGDDSERSSNASALSMSAGSFASEPPPEKKAAKKPAGGSSSFVRRASISSQILNSVVPGFRAAERSSVVSVKFGTVAGGGKGFFEVYKEVGIPADVRERPRSGSQSSESPSPRTTKKNSGNGGVNSPSTEIAPKMTRQLSCDRGSEPILTRQGSAPTLGRQGSSLEGSSPGAAVFGVLPLWDLSRTDSGKMNSMTPKQFRTTRFVEDVEDDKHVLIGSFFQKYFMLHPSSTKHLLWDMFGLLLIGWDCITVPLLVFDAPQDDLEVMAWVVRLFWTVNIGVTFLTGFLQPQGTVEMNPYKVARRYSVTWLPFDISVGAFDWFEAIGYGAVGTGRFGGAFRGLRMFRTVRIVRLIRLPDLTRSMTDNIRSEELILAATIFKIMVFMFLLTHFMACMWYGLGRLLGEESPDTDTWIKERHLDEADVNLGSRYTFSLHWAIAQFSGETLMEPVNLGERGFTVAALFFTFMVATAFISSFTTSMTAWQRISSKQSQQLTQLRRYLADNKISRALGVRVQRNAQHALRERKRNTPEAEIALLAMISEPLLIELHFEVYSDILQAHPLFYYYNDINPPGVKKICHTAVGFLSLTHGDVLFSLFEVPTRPRMFYVVRGKLEYKQDGVSKSVEAGDWICEHVLWTKWTHNGTLRAITECRLVQLDSEKFLSIVGLFPMDQLLVYAEAFVKRLNKKGWAAMSDVGENGPALMKRIAKAFPAPGTEVTPDNSEDEGEESDSDEESSSDDSEDYQPEQENVIQALRRMGSLASVCAAPAPMRPSKVPRSSGMARPSTQGHSAIARMVTSISFGQSAPTAVQPFRASSRFAA